MAKNLVKSSYIVGLTQMLNLDLDKIEEGETYTLTCYVENESNPSYMPLPAGFTKEDGAGSFSTCSGIIIDVDNSRQECLLTVDGNLDNPKIIIDLQNVVGTLGNHIYCKQLMLVRGSTPADYEPYVDESISCGIKVGEDLVSDIYVGEKTVSAIFEGDSLAFYKEETPMEVLMYDRTRQVKFKTKHPTAYDKDRYVPIGIVVIPTEHDVYGDGTCGVLSLLWLSYTKPDTGIYNHEILALGQSGSDIGLKYYNDIAHCGSINNEPWLGVVGIKAIDYATNSGSSVVIPYKHSEQQKWKQCPTDLETYYGKITNSNGVFCPSPYLEDGTKNHVYGQIDFQSNSTNILADFDGKGATKRFLDAATAQPDWKTDAVLENESGAGYSPAACSAWRYHTEGTNQGDWYIPSLAELIYISPRFDDIVETIGVLQNHFTDTDISYLILLANETGSYWYGCSNMCNATTPFILSISKAMSTISKYSGYTFAFRAFTRF